jgi:hypothetical protein
VLEGLFGEQGLGVARARELDLTAGQGDGLDDESGCV